MIKKYKEILKFILKELLVFGSISFEEFYSMFLLKLSEEGFAGIEFYDGVRNVFLEFKCKEKDIEYLMVSDNGLDQKGLFSEFNGLEFLKNCGRG